MAISGNPRSQRSILRTTQHECAGSVVLHLLFAQNLSGMGLKSGRTDYPPRRRRTQLLREQELDLETPLPSGPVGRCFYVVEDLRIDVHRLFADSEHLADAAAERDSPLFAAIGLPVGGDDRRARQVPVRSASLDFEGVHQIWQVVEVLRSRGSPFVSNEVIKANVVQLDGSCVGFERHGVPSRPGILEFDAVNIV